MKYFLVFFSRGFGSISSIAFTILIARTLDVNSSAKWFFILNLITVISVCLRWGYDDVIVRSVATAFTFSDKEIVIKDLIYLFTSRIIINSAIIFAIYIIIDININFDKISTMDFFYIIIGSAILSLSVCVGRIYQGLGYINRAAFIITILVPLLSILTILLLPNLSIDIKLHTVLITFLFAILCSFLIPYYYLAKEIVVLNNIYSKFITNAFNFRNKLSCPLTKSANHLGFVVLAQQALQWGSLLLVPLIFNSEVYTAYVVSQKSSMSVSLVALIVGFSISGKIATLFKSGSVDALRKYLKIGSFIILLGSLAFLSILYILSNYIFSFSKINYVDKDIIFLELLVGQIPFGLSSFFAIFLTMSGNEKFLTKVILMANLSGLIIFYVVASVFGIVLSCVVFFLIYSLVVFIIFNKISSELIKASPILL